MAMADPSNTIGESSKNQDNLETIYLEDSLTVCDISPTTESDHNEVLHIFS